MTGPGDQSKPSLEAKKPSLSFHKTVTNLEDINTPFKQHLYEALHSTWMEYGMALIILGNFALIIAETNIKAEESQDDSPLWMDVLSWSVLVIFCVELILRLYVGKLNFFKDPWNCFDFMIISADLIFSFIAELFSNLLPISLLRILRLAKVARISKVFRVFPELRLMLGGLVGAMRAIMWGTILMAIAMLICAVLAVQFIHPLNKELAERGVYDDVGCYNCGAKFASVQKSALTFWQQILAGDGWGQTAIPIIENYPAAAIYFLGVFLVLALALHNLILGVIVDVAQESRKKLQQDADKKKLLLRMETQTHLLQMCCDMDTDQSGCLTKAELLQGYQDNVDFRLALTDLDVQEADLDVVWLLMDKDRSGTIHYDEFVTELYNMRSSESQFMLTYIKYYVTVIKDRILEEIAVVENEMNAVQKEMKIMENMEKDILDHEMGSSSRAPSKEKANVEDKAAEEPLLQQNNSKERPAHLVSDELFADLLKEIRYGQAAVTSRLEAIDAKVELSMSEHMQRMRGTVSWSLPLPCQSVSAGNQKVVIQTPANSRQQSDRALAAVPNGSDAPKWGMDRENTAASRRSGHGTEARYTV